MHVFMHTCTLIVMFSTVLTAEPIFTNERNSLTWEKAYNILQSQEWSHVECNVPPVRPKSGEVFLYRALDAAVLPHMRILSHTRMGQYYVPYAYGRPI